MRPHTNRTSATRYPTPRDIGVVIPPHLRPERFCAGFEHGLKGGQLDHIEYFRLSFRLGFRTAKLYLRELRRRQGVIELPRHRMRLTARWE
jgi:hypothetical protein